MEKSETNTQYSKVFSFFKDFWALVKHFFEVENTEEYWSNLIYAGEKLVGDHLEDGVAEVGFYKEIFIAFAHYQDRKNKERFNDK